VLQYKNNSQAKTGAYTLNYHSRVKVYFMFTVYLLFKIKFFLSSFCIEIVSPQGHFDLQNYVQNPVVKTTVKVGTKKFTSKKKQG